MFNPYDVVYTVLITEKATALSEKFHRYTIKSQDDELSWQAQAHAQRPFGQAPRLEEGPRYID